VVYTLYVVVAALHTWPTILPQVPALPISLFRFLENPPPKEARAFLWKQHMGIITSSTQGKQEKSKYKSDRKRKTKQNAHRTWQVQSAH
jgi:hypothetical protein